MAKIPDRAEHQRRFAGLSFAERRAIIRAVNRGQVLEDRNLAALAVGVARRQQRFWRLAWLIGPAIALIQLTYTDLQIALINGAVGTATVTLLSVWWFTRARRAERLNTEAVEGRATAGDPRSRNGEDDGASRPRRHLPGSKGAAADTATSALDRPVPDAGSVALPPGQRPYRPRGRKRRG